MSIIHVYISRSDVKRLRLADRGYLKKKLKTNCMLNNLLHKPINRPLLDELQCILDSKPIPRRKSINHNGPMTVRKVSAEEMDRLWSKPKEGEEYATSL